MKKLIIFLILILIDVNFASAEYINWSGEVSEAFYLSDVNDNNRDTYIDQERKVYEAYFGYRLPLGKLSKNHSSLLWGALNEWDYRVGEYYTVTIDEREEGMSLLVKITAKGNVSFWCLGHVYKNNYHR